MPVPNFYLSCLTFKIKNFKTDTIDPAFKKTSSAYENYQICR